MEIFKQANKINTTYLSNLSSLLIDQGNNLIMLNNKIDYCKKIISIIESVHACIHVRVYD